MAKGRGILSSGPTTTRDPRERGESNKLELHRDQLRAEVARRLTDYLTTWLATSGRRTESQVRWWWTKKRITIRVVDAFAGQIEYFNISSVASCTVHPPATEEEIK